MLVWRNPVELSLLLPLLSVCACPAIIADLRSGARDISRHLGGKIVRASVFGRAAQA